MEDNDLIKKLKKEYENIKVNEEGVNIMKKSIQNAKKQKTNKIKWISVAAAALAIFIITPNVSPTIAMAMSKVPIISGIVKVITLNKYSNEDKNIDVQYPVVQNDENSIENLNENIDTFIKTAVENFEKEMEIQEYGNLDISYEILENTESTFAIKINATEVMASGYEFSKVYNLDKMTGNIVQLKDLFKENTNYIEILSENVKNQMIEQMEADENKVYFLNDEISENNFEQIKENQDFYVKENGDLVLFFSEYEVAPGSMGEVQFIINKQDIAEYLK